MDILTSAGHGPYTVDVHRCCKHTKHLQYESRTINNHQRPLLTLNGRHHLQSTEKDSKLCIYFDKHLSHGSSVLNCPNYRFKDRELHGRGTLLTHVITTPLTNTSRKWDVTLKQPEGLLCQACSQTFTMALCTYSTTTCQIVVLANTSEDIYH